MLAPQATTGWAQVGYVKDTAVSSSTYFLTQYKRNTATAPVTGYWASGGGVRYTYKTQYNSATQRIDMYVNTTKYSITNFDPNLYWGGQPWSSQYSGETGHCQSDMPGTAGDHEGLAFVKLLSGSSWVTPSSPQKTVNCSTRYAQLTLGSGTFDIWTK